MKPELAKRIRKTIQSVGREHKWSQRLVRAICKEMREDLILPQLGLRRNARIAFDYPSDAEISITIGCRDFQFNRKTGECVGAGTFLG